MEYLVVYSFGCGKGSANVLFRHSPPTINDIRDAEIEIQKINKFAQKPVIINWLEISDDLEDVKTDNEQIPIDGWIPVSERLPKENKTYICTVLRFVDDYVYSAELIYCPADDTWAWWDDPEGLYAFDYKTHRVVAWMPLPEPYRPE